MKKRYVVRGKELTEADLAALKAQVEEFDVIEHIDEDMREVLESEWPELAKEKLPPARRS